MINGSDTTRGYVAQFSFSDTSLLAGAEIRRVVSNAVEDHDNLSQFAAGRSCDARSPAIYHLAGGRPFWWNATAVR